MIFGVVRDQGNRSREVLCGLQIAVLRAQGGAQGEKDAGIVRLQRQGALEGGDGRRVLLEPGVGQAEVEMGRARSRIKARGAFQRRDRTGRPPLLQIERAPIAPADGFLAARGVGRCFRGRIAARAAQRHQGDEEAPLHRSGRWPHQRVGQRLPQLVFVDGDAVSIALAQVLDQIFERLVFALAAQ